MKDILTKFAAPGDTGTGTFDGGVNPVGPETGTNLTQSVTNILNVVIGVLGIVAVIVIIIGGIQYMTSTGDAGKVKKAKDTILYGVIGLVVVILAFAIVNFVIANING